MSKSHSTDEHSVSQEENSGKVITVIICNFETFSVFYIIYCGALLMGRARVGNRGGEKKFNVKL